MNSNHYNPNSQAFHDRENIVFHKNFSQSNEVICMTEIWRRDPVDQDLWHGSNGLVINGAALDERRDYYNIVIER